MAEIVETTETPPRPAWAGEHDVVVVWNDGTRDHLVPPDVKQALEERVRGQAITADSREIYALNEEKPLYISPPVSSIKLTKTDNVRALFTCKHDQTLTDEADEVLDLLHAGDDGGTRALRATRGGGGGGDDDAAAAADDDYDDDDDGDTDDIVTFEVPEGFIAPQALGAAHRDQ